MIFFKTFITTLLFVCYSLSSFAQNRAIVFGKITNFSTRSLKITYAENDIDGSQIVMETDIDHNGEYAIVIEIDEPKAVFLEYNKKEILLFLSPKSHLELNFNDADFYKSIRFSGSGYKDNSFLHRYVLKYGMRNKFKKFYVSGIVVPDSIFLKMKNLSPDAFKTYITEQQRSEKEFYENDPIQQDLSPALKIYFESMFTYKWSSYLLAYADFKEDDDEVIPDEFYNFLHDLEISNNDAVIQPAYGDFLNVYFDYTFETIHGDSINDNSLRFGLMYELVEKELSGLAEEYMLGRLLTNTIKPANIPFITTYYQNFQSRSEVSSYRNAVQDYYERAAAFSSEQTAPPIVLKNADGNTVSLTDFEGKLIYISFWATWCKPCVKEIEESVANRVKLQGQDIVFLYVSVDDDEKKWKRFLNSTPTYGVNVRTKGAKNPISKAYNVVSLPSYFLLDKKGQFISDFKKASDPDFILYIKGLLEK